MMTNEPVAKKSLLKPAILLGFISFIVYSNTLRNGLALDDHIIIQKNTLVAKGFSAIPELFSTPYHYGHAPVANDLYRPLSLVMFAAEHQIFGDGTLISHLINVLLFCGCVVLLLLFLDALFEQKKTVVAFLASMLFALHPIHTEVVANIKSRDELLCFFFSFAALNMFLKFARTGNILQMILGAALFFLSLLSKETSITFIGTVPLVFFIYKKDDKQKSLVITASTAAIALTYLLIRFSVLSHHHVGKAADVSFIDNFLSGASGYSVRVATAFSILGNYIKLLFVPYPLVCDHSYNSIAFVGLGSVAFLLPLVVYLSLAVLSVFRLIKNRKDPLAFGILFFLITIALFSNIVFLTGAAMAERFVFFASVGFCLAIAWAIDRWLLKDAGSDMSKIKNTKLLAVFIPLCLIYSALTVARNSEWKDNNTLFRADIRKSPKSSRLHYYLGTDLLIAAETNRDTAQAKEGITHLKKALAIYPGFALVIPELGTTYLQMKNYDSAQYYLEWALANDPKDTLAMHQLAGVYFYKQQYEQSIKQCLNAIEIEPNYARGYRNMGICYMKMGKNDYAIEVFRIAATLEPGNQMPYQNLAYLFKLQGNMDSVKKYAR